MTRSRSPAEQHHLTRRRIAQGIVASVDACDCGQLHLQIGPLSVALHADVLFDLEDVVEQALLHLHPERAQVPNTALLGLRQPEGGEA